MSPDDMDQDPPASPSGEVIRADGFGDPPLSPVTVNAVGDDEIVFLVEKLLELSTLEKLSGYKIEFVHSTISDLRTKVVELEDENWRLENLLQKSNEHAYELRRRIDELLTERSGLEQVLDRESNLVLLLTLASPDESSLKYEVELLMHLVWFDPRLKFHIFNTTGTNLDFSPHFHEAIPVRHNPQRRQYLDALHHFGRVWVPDVYFVKHGDFRANLDPANVALRIFPNGTVNFTARRHLILSCQGDLAIFPFDDPKCTFSIESISHEKDALEFRWQTKTGVLRKSPNLSFLNAYLAHNETSYCESSHWRGNYSCLKVELVFNRDRAFYFTTVFIPDIILVTSSFITFWLEWNAVPARVMLGVTTMLNFFTTSNGFRSTLPVVSNLTAMNIWDGFSMFFIYASLLEFVFVNYIGRKRPRRPADLGIQPTIQLNKIEDNAPTTPSGPGGNRPTEIVTCTTCSSGTTPCTHPANNGCAPPRIRRRIIENPIRVAKTIDVVSRIVFPFCYAIFLIVFFIIHKAFVDHTLHNETDD